MRHKVEDSFILDEFLKSGPGLELEDDSACFILSEEQRNASWTKSHVEELYETISKIMKRNLEKIKSGVNPTPGRIGDIQIDKRSYNETNKTIIISEGQQRITSITIAVLSLMRTIEKKFANHLNSELQSIVDEIKNNYLFSVDSSLNKSPKLLLNNIANNRIDFWKILIEDDQNYLKINCSKEANRVVCLYKDWMSIMNNLETEGDFIQFYKYGLKQITAGIQYIVSDEERSEEYNRINHGFGLTHTVTQKIGSKLGEFYMSHVKPYLSEKLVDEGDSIIHNIKSHDKTDIKYVAYANRLCLSPSGDTLMISSKKKLDKAISDRLAFLISQGSIEEKLKFLNNFSNTVIFLENLETRSTGSEFDILSPLIVNDVFLKTAEIDLYYRDDFKIFDTIEKRLQLLRVLSAPIIINSILGSGAFASTSKIRLSEFLPNLRNTTNDPDIIINQLKNKIKTEIPELRNIWGASNPKDSFIKGFKKINFKTGKKVPIPLILSNINFEMSCKKSSFDLTNIIDYDSPTSPIEIEHIVAVSRESSISGSVDNIGNLSLLEKNNNAGANSSAPFDKIPYYNNSKIVLNKDLVNNYDLQNFKDPSIDDRAEALGEIAWSIWGLD